MKVETGFGDFHRKGTLPWGDSESRDSFGGKAALDPESAPMVLRNQGDGKKNLLGGAPEKRALSVNHLDLGLGGLEGRAQAGTDGDKSGLPLWIGNLVPETHARRLQVLPTENGNAALPGEPPVTREYQADSPSKRPAWSALPRPLAYFHARPP